MARVSGTVSDVVRAGRRPYDYDVAVIGAGPAGLAAAIRARWLKGFDPWPSSVVVFDPGPIGGLGRWGSCVLTGPGWSLSGAELTERLSADIASLAIPVVRARVTRVEREGPYLVVRTDGLRVRTLSVVIAAGLRPLANEEAHFPAGVTIAMKGRAHLRALVRRAAELGRARGLVVIGNARTSLLLPLFAETIGGVRTHWVIEPSTTADPAANGCEPTPWPGPIHHARLSSVDGEAEVEGVTLDSPRGALRIPCSSVFVDYHAFELEPAISVAGLLDLGIRTTRQGFVETDVWSETGAPGIFAAGDVTGRYASTLTALGDGVSAGFGAHRHAFRAKFGVEPDLFAYRGLDRPLRGPAEQEPPFDDDVVPVLVGEPDRARAALERMLAPALASALVEAITIGDLTLAEMCVRLEVPRATLGAALHAAIHAREVVLHRAPAATPSREDGRS